MADVRDISPPTDQDQAAALPSRNKLIALLGLLLSAGFFFATWASYTVSKESIHDSIVDWELPLTSDNIYTEIQKDLIRPVFISSMMASDTFLRDWIIGGEKNQEQIVKYLHEVKERYGVFTAFLISDKTSNYYYAHGLLKQISREEPRDLWYYRVRDMKPAYEINVDPDLGNEDALTVFINHRVFDYDGRFLGATGVGLTVDFVRDAITTYQTRYNRNIYFVNQNGKIVMVGRKRAFTLDTIEQIEGLDKLADKIFSKRDGTFQYENQGATHLLNVRFIPELNWYLFVEKIEDEALSGVRRAFKVNLAVCLAVTAVVLTLTGLTVTRYNRRLEAMATTDKLTGLTNRQTFDAMLSQAAQESRRTKNPITVIMADVDRFKEINDRLGHLAGDSVLMRIARVLTSKLRASDMVCRWGGEEFCLALKSCEEAHGVIVAEMIREAIEKDEFLAELAGRTVTLSLGVAQYQPDGRLEQTLAGADLALYAAKRAGRNAIRAASLAGSEERRQA